MKRYHSWGVLICKELYPHCTGPLQSPKNIRAIKNTNILDPAMQLCIQHSSQLSLKCIYASVSTNALAMQSDT
jgi:hypothetical protein